jgi:hypothetical protein
MYKRIKRKFFLFKLKYAIEINLLNKLNKRGKGFKRVVRIK